MDTKTITTQFELHTRLFNNVLADLDDGACGERANDKVNHVKWLASHLLAVRLGMNSFGNLPADESMMDYLRTGVDQQTSYPSLQKIQSRWNEISPLIGKGLASMSSGALAGDSPVKVPVSDTTLGGYLGFLMHHEAYHLGQLGILRKYLGRDAMAYS